MKWDYETEDKEISKMITYVEKLMAKKFDKPCRKYAIGCANCQIWKAWDLFKMMFY